MCSSDLRICSVFRQLNEKGFEYQEQVGLQHLSMLTESHEQALITRLSCFAEVIEASAINYEPHQLAYYLRDLANDLHTYYNAHQFLVDDPNLRNARLVLIAATRQVIKNGSKIIGVSSPEVM